MHGPDNAQNCCRQREHRQKLIVVLDDRPLDIMARILPLPLSLPPSSPSLLSPLRSLFSISLPPACSSNIAVASPWDAVLVGWPAMRRNSSYPYYSPSLLFPLPFPSFPYQLSSLPPNSHPLPPLGGEVILLKFEKRNPRHSAAPKADNFSFPREQENRLSLLDVRCQPVCIHPRLCFSLPASALGVLRRLTRGLS